MCGVLLVSKLLCFNNKMVSSVKMDLQEEDKVHKIKVKIKHEEL